MTKKFKKGIIEDWKLINYWKRIQLINHKIEQIMSWDISCTNIWNIVSWLSALISLLEKAIEWNRKVQYMMEWTFNYKQEDMLDYI